MSKWRVSLMETSTLSAKCPRIGKLMGLNRTKPFTGLEADAILGPPSI